MKTKYNLLIFSYFNFSGEMSLLKIDHDRRRSGVGFEGRLVFQRCQILCIAIVHLKARHRAEIESSKHHPPIPIPKVGHERSMIGFAILTGKKLRHLLSKRGRYVHLLILTFQIRERVLKDFFRLTCMYLMPIFDVRPIWSKNRFSLFCNNVIATFCYSNLKAENDDDKAAKDCLCDDDGGNVDCHKIPLVSRFIVSFAFCL